MTMKLWDRLILAFTIPAIPTGHEEKLRDQVRQIVAQNSHGDVRLLRGEYETAEDKEEKYEKIIRGSKRFTAARAG